MLVVFCSHPWGGCLTVLHRDDGVVLELSPVSRKWRVPHDMAHVATERALGISDGVFGTLAAGGVFGNMRVARGRPRHDAAARSARLLSENSRSLSTAEMLAGAMHAASSTVARVSRSALCADNGRVATCSPARGRMRSCSARSTRCASSTTAGSRVDPTKASTWSGPRG